MELRNLKTFLRVAALKNFTAAGVELGYSQANISAQIKQLEREVGAPLFDRIGRTVSLTQYGEALLPYARSIVSTAVEMESLLRRDEDLACLIDDPLPPGQWQVLAAAETRAVAAVNSSHPLAGRGRVRVEELAGQELIFMEHAAPYGLQFTHALSRQGLEPAPFLTLQSPAMAGRLLEAGPYLSILPFFTVAQGVEAGRLAVLRVPGLEMKQTIQVVLHRDKAPVPQLTGFARLAGEAIAGLPGVEA